MIYDINVQEVRAAKRNIKAPLQNSPCLNLGCTTSADHLHLEIIWGPFILVVPTRLQTVPSPLQFKLNLLWKHNILLPAFSMCFRSIAYLGQSVHRAKLLPCVVKQWEVKSWMMYESFMTKAVSQPQASHQHYAHVTTAVTWHRSNCRDGLHHIGAFQRVKLLKSNRTWCPF